MLSIAPQNYQLLNEAVSHMQPSGIYPVTQRISSSPTTLSFSQEEEKIKKTKHLNKTKNSSRKRKTLASLQKTYWRKLLKCSSLSVYPLVANGLEFVFKRLLRAHILAVHLDSDWGQTYISKFIKDVGCQYCSLKLVSSWFWGIVSKF